MLDTLRARARRVVTIRWRETTDATAMTQPEFLNVYERRDRQWHASLTGSVMELVRWSAGQPIEDLSIGQPDLTLLFQRYYAPEELDE